MYIKKSIVLFVAAVTAVLFVYIPQAHANTKPDLLYKFGSYWTDVATDGTSLYMTNSAYSQINKYVLSTGAYSTTFGGYGTAVAKLNQPMGLEVVGTSIYVADTGNSRVQKLKSSDGTSINTWGSLGSDETNRLNNPQDIAVNATESHIFVADTGNNRIAAIKTSSGVFKYIGTLGTGQDQFSSPRGIAVMDSGAANVLWVYVADTGNNRIVKYSYNTSTDTFTYLSKFGLYGSATNEKFNQPNKITIDSETVPNLYITDTTNRIQKYTSLNVFVKSWTVKNNMGATGLSSITSLCPACVTTLYVVEPYHQIDAYNAQTGVSSSAFGGQTSFRHEPIRPIDVEVDKSNSIYVYITDTDSIAPTPSVRGVQKFNSLWVPQIEYIGNGSAFSGVKGIGVSALNGSKELYVADTANNRIQRFNNLGVYSSTIPTPMVTPVNFNGPKDIAVDNSGYMYVADSTNQRILQYDANNNFVWAIGGPTPVIPTLAPSDPTPDPLTPTPGAPTGAFFSDPAGIAADSQSTIYVADAGYHRIQKFNASGTFIKAWGQFGIADSLTEPQLNSPQGLAVETISAGEYNIYVADTVNNRVQRFNQLGVVDTATGIWGGYGPGDGSFINPKKVALDSSARIYVCENGASSGNTRNDRIQVFGDAATSADVSIMVGGTDATIDGVNLTEGLTEDTTGVATYTVRLKTQPQVAVPASPDDLSTVTVTLSVDKPTQAYVITSDPLVTTPTLTFNQFNWNIPQTVTVVPKHDYVALGTHSVTITHTITSSFDANYKSSGNNLLTKKVPVTITDTVDVAGITLQSGYNEAGTGNWIPYTDLVNTVPWATEGATLSNAYYIKLNTRPTKDVSITLTGDSSIEKINGVSSPLTLTFTAPDPASAYSSTESLQYVMIKPLHDYVAQATHSAIIAHAITSVTDPVYSSANSSLSYSGGSGNMLVTIQDHIDDIVGVTVSKQGITMNETGTGNTGTYTVVLNSKPASDVTINVADASSSAHVTFDHSSLVFTSSDWSTPKPIIVTAIPDYLANPVDFSPSITRIIHTATAAPGSAYNGVNVASVSATIINTDISNLLISKSGGGSVQVTEGSVVTDSYSIQLTSMPTSNVYVTISSDDKNATTSAYFYTFGPSTWNVSQLVTVSAVDNAIVDGTHYGDLIHTLTSLDLNFSGKVAHQTATIIDNDSVGITITLPNGAINIVEAGPSDSYFVRLSSQPASQVTLAFDAQGQATSSPILNPGVENAQNLVFNQSNWNINQEVVITAIQDSIVEGPTIATVKYTGVSSDTNYNGKTATFLANISDDDSTTPGISVLETDGGTSVTKDLLTDTYTIRLTSKPSANVKIKIVANGPEATTSAGIFWFTPTAPLTPATGVGIWSSPQTVSVLAKTNPSGSKTVVFSHQVTSADLHYNNISAPTVTVTVNQNGGLTSSSGNVKAPTCNKTAPYSAPNLFQVTTNQTQATIYFTPIRENISYYFVAFGFEPGDMRFGTSFEWGPYDGVINYTVNMLTPGTQYYFMVRGGNGCATGPWSNSLAGTAVGSESSAWTTRSYYASTTATSSGSSGTTSGSTSSGSSSSPTGGIWLTRDLFPGYQGADVRSLQQYLNSKGFTLASSGAGSPGNETTYYGNLTAGAVRRFQEAHFAEILSPLGYASGTGMCGWSTRNYINTHP